MVWQTLILPKFYWFHSISIGPLSFYTKQIWHFIALLVYVDDVILAGDFLETIEHIKKLLHQAFKIKNLRNLKYFLGFEVTRSHKGIHLCQRKYVIDILSLTGMIGCKPCSTPYFKDTKALYEPVDLLPDPTVYRRLIGKVLYLTNTRLDLCFSIHLLSQFMQAPSSLTMLLFNMS